MTEHATSADGTAIAYERSGEGPAVVVVFGALCDRSATIATPGRLLDSCFTVFNYDRRGRGDSGDAPAYSVDREVEDLAAVIEVAGGTAHVFGHSSGAILALRASRAGLGIQRLAVYEPPFILDGTRPRPSADLADRVRELIGQGRRAEALQLDLTEAKQVRPEALARMQTSKIWGDLLGLAHTLAYDLDVCGPGNFLPVEEMSQVSVPTLVVNGSESPAWLRASAARLAATIPGARHSTLAGQGHGAKAEVLAPVLRDFYLIR